MATTRSFPTQHPSGISITDTRRVTAGLVARNADGTPRAGVFPAGTAPLVTGRASMGYDVAPFLAATSRINTGVELIANDAVTVVTTTAAPASNSRIDVIWVRSQFAQHTDANNDVVFGVTQGAPAAIPGKPVIPAGALELATATILSTTTTTATVVITQTHPFTAAAGGTVWVRNAAEMAAWAAPNGAKVLRLDTGFEWSRVDGAWVHADEKNPIAVLRRTTAALALGNNTYADLSATGAWTASYDVLRGFGAYANGLTVVVPGEYELFWSLWLIPSAGGLVGIAVNAAGTPGGNELHAIDHVTFRVIALGNASARVRLAAGDKLTLWGYGEGGAHAIRGAAAREPMHWGARWIAP